MKLPIVPEALTCVHSDHPAFWKACVAFLTALLITLVTLTACNGGDMSQTKVRFESLDTVPQPVWDQLAKKRIYFGHQSVGFNIMGGVKDVMKAYPKIKLNITETADPSDFKTGIFAHSRVGKNVDPVSKVTEFAQFMDAGIGKSADFSFMKFCFVDIKADTNILDVFKHYKTTMDRLSKKYPSMTIIHFTVPLTWSKTTWKTVVKKLIGRATWEYDDNIKRNEYNDLLRKTYQGKESVFDLATIESTYPDGRRSTFTKTGKTYYSLAPEYTNDGGHLNALGRKIVAEKLLVFLANLSQ